METLHKSERICSKILIERMFTGGVSFSFSMFPLRVVCMPLEEAQEPVSLLVSVSKRRFKRAVKRNRVKRQIREAYRKNRSLLSDVVAKSDKKAALAFIYLSNELVPSELIEEKMKLALTRIAERWD